LNSFLGQYDYVLLRKGVLNLLISENNRRSEENRLSYKSDPDIGWPIKKRKFRKKLIDGKEFI